MDHTDWLLLKKLRETRNMTNTASALGLSQPAVSKRLQHLERSFNTIIASRAHDGMKFTPAGEYLARYAGEMLESLQSAYEHINNLMPEVKGILRIGASAYSIHFILPEILAAFRREYPKVEFKVISAWSADIVRMVSSGEIHIGLIRNSTATLPGRSLLLSEKMYVCSMKELNVENLPEEAGIMYKDDPQLTSDLSAWWTERYSKPPTVAMQVDHLDAGMALVSKGLGYMFLEEKAAGLLKTFKYTLRHSNGQPYTRHTWVVPNHDARKLRLVSRFLEFMFPVQRRLSPSPE